MIQITQEKWDSVPMDYKSTWGPSFRDIPDHFIGKRNVLEGCIVEGGGSALITEGVHFEIVVTENGDYSVIKEENKYRVKKNGRIIATFRKEHEAISFMEFTQTWRGVES